MKKLLSLLLALSMVLSLAACSGSSASTTSDNTDSDTSAAADTADSGTSTAASDVKIAYIPKERAESFWQAVEAGAQAAADDLGVELVMYGDAAGSNTAGKQSTYVETATELGVNAIVFAALDSDSTDAALQSAQAEGITVVGFDSDPGAEARDWFVNQVDPDELAAVLLDDLVENIGDQYTADDPAEVYLVSTSLTTPNQNSWIEAIKRAYYTDYETVYDEDGDIIYAGDGDGLTELESFLTAHSDANALVSLTTNVIASCNSAIQSCDLEGQCIFNGIATPSDSEAYLENGNMTTVVLWQAYDLGYLAINTAYSAVVGELESGATEYVSNLCGQTQVEGVSTYADTHKVDGATVYLGGPATFTLDTLDCWKS